MQDVQAEFLESREAPGATERYCIIEDTLDSNMDFTQDKGDQAQKYPTDAPFFFEIPVMIPGTGNVLNGAFGYSSYDGPGMVYPYITGKNFKKLGSEEEVRTAPMSWTVVTDQDTGTQKLIINVGKLGLTEAENTEKNGMTFSMAEGSNWKNVTAELDKKINEAQNKAAALERGEDSPVYLLDDREAQLERELSRIFNMGLSGNDAAKQEEAKAFFAAFKMWREEIKLMTPFLGDDGKPLPGVQELPDYSALKTIVINSQGQNLTNNKIFNDFDISAKNLFKDQYIYLKNRMDYKESWIRAKEDYENARDFYQNGQIFGFVMKYATKITNTSVDAFSNRVKVSLGDRGWEAEDTLKQKYNSGVTGNYQVGSYVIQKADSIYATDGDDQNDILEVQKDGSGLSGAKFELYCSTAQEPDTEPDTTDEHLAHFWEKGASENKDTYRYTHTGTEHSGIDTPAKELEVAELETGYIDGNGNTVDNGRLVVSNIAKKSDHSHWLREIETPRGYYTSSKLIQLDANTEQTLEQDQVNYLLVPNVARAVALQKIDSNSKQPVAGAEFELYQSDGTLVEGFVTKTMKENTFYWRQDGGEEKLMTNEDGYLYIHGLDSGSYYLQEKTPASGYKPPSSAKKYEFTLEGELPETVEKDKDGFYRIKLNGGKAVENDPKTADLYIHKKSLADVDDKSLADAYFALFCWKGTEAEWKEWQLNPGSMRNWEDIKSFNTADSSYYKTSNTTKSISADTGGGERIFHCVVSDENGKLNISGIPLGHYFIIEVKAPQGYEHNEMEYYFDVDQGTVDTDLKLYKGLNGSNPLEQDKDKGNIIRNSSEPAQLALVKYDGVSGPSVTDGERMPPKAGQDWNETTDGWKYGDGKIDMSNKGLDGAVYKLFRQYGQRPNWNPKDLKDSNNCQSFEFGYDLGIAIGTTKHGVLRLADMQGKNGTDVRLGLPPANYYMIEMEAPKGYILDETPILFPLNQSSVKDGKLGLIKRVKNQEARYGISVLKVDKEDTAKSLSGAEFTLTEKGAAEPLRMRMTESGKYIADRTSAESAMWNAFDGTLYIQGLEKGKTYLLRETLAPQGYAKSEELVEITAGEGTEPKDSVYYTHKVMTNEKRKGVVKLSKADGDSYLPLAGAEFTLYRLVREEIKPGDPDYDPGGLTNERFSEEVVQGPKETDKNGELIFENLDWSSSYFLRETKAPDGYLLNETALWFEIDQYSFDVYGDPIPVFFPNLNNYKGIAGEVVLRKVDAENTDTKLRGAVFTLWRSMTDPNGNIIDVQYGKPTYTTDKNGEIRISLPAGSYYFRELTPPPEYLPSEEFLKKYPFEIGDKEADIDGGKPQIAKLVEIANQKGDTGLILRKKITGTDIPLQKVGFEFYKGVSEDLLYFTKDQSGVYHCVGLVEQAGAVSKMETDKNGEIRALFPGDFVPKSPDDLTEIFSKVISYEEVSGPDGIIVDGTRRLINATGHLEANFWSTVSVTNELEHKDSASIEILKTSGKTKLPLPGAVFELRVYFGPKGDGTDMELTVDTQTADQRGRVIFENLDSSLIYHVVEVDTPKGYIKDETHHEVIWNTEEDYGPGFVPKKKIFYLQNDQSYGNVILTKVAGTDPNKKLEGAEFELLKEEVVEGTVVWAHYDQLRYVTDGNGMIRIESLPHGNYQLIERSAPNGYITDGTPINFSIAEDAKGELIELAAENKEVPGPKGNVEVTKQDAQNSGIKLPGAGFHLYQMGADGKWHRYNNQVKIYETGVDGKLVIEYLPAGMYCLKEVQAPEKEWRFTIGVEEAAVQLVITNSKLGSGSSHRPKPDPIPDFITRPDLASNPDPGLTPGVDTDTDADNQTGSRLEEAGATDGTMPQTGQNNMAVILLAMVGIILLALGFSLDQRRRQK